MFYQCFISTAYLSWQSKPYQPLVVNAAQALKSFWKFVRVASLGMKGFSKSSAALQEQCHCFACARSDVQGFTPKSN